MTQNTRDSITDVPGIRVGHAQDEKALTGCTVILADRGAVGGVDQRGGAPGTRETDLLRPMHLVQHVNAILLSGGSAFGLDAASGVMRYLEEKGVGVNTGAVKVPIVPSAILYDLAIGDPKVRPDAAMGYQACLNAAGQAPAEGCVGAGTGATVGKILGPGQSVKSGIGTASMEIGGGGGGGGHCGGQRLWRRDRPRHPEDHRGRAAFEKRAAQPGRAGGLCEYT